MTHLHRRFAMSAGTSGRRNTLRLLLQLGAAAACLAVPAVQAQGWPSKPVRLIVPYPAGGGVDVLARALAQRLQGKWGQSVVVDNRPGGNTILGTEIAARATDQHTLLLTTDATFTINPSLHTKLPYSLERDFIPITQLVSFSQLLVVSSALPVDSLQGLLALARQKPGSLSYASYGPGSQPQLATEMIKLKSRTFIVHVPYRGIPQAVMAVVGQEVPMTWSGIPSASPHIASGKLKPLAYGGKTRSAAYPGVPTVGELGFPEVDANVWVGVFSPAGMPPGTVQKIHQDLQLVLSEPEFRQREIDAKGYELVGLGPADFKRHIERETVSRAATLKAANVKPE